LGKTEVVDQVENDRLRVEVLAYSSLGGAKDHQTAATIYFAGQAGIWLKQVRITLQTRIRGSGICVFELPVPADEVVRIDMKDETLQVDGNFALMRTGQIEFSVEKSTKGLFGTRTGGEGLLQTFRGTGSVWLAPTQDIYQKLQSGGLASMKSASRLSHTAT
jgi:uncharacterized protein (AIM24 family)